MHRKKQKPRAGHKALDPGMNGDQDIGTRVVVCVDAAFDNTGGRCWGIVRCRGSFLRGNKARGRAQQQEEVY